MSSEQKDLGIPLGEMGSPIHPVQASFESRGVKIHYKTVHRLRIGRYSGSRIRDLLEYNELLTSDDASRKDELFLDIALTGENERTNLTTHDRHRFSSLGLTKAIADQLGIDKATMQRLIVAMREDIILYDLEHPQGQLYSDFLTMYKKYLDHRLFEGRPLQSGYSQALFDRFGWGPSTLTDFYRFTYTFHLVNGPMLGTLLPYEIEMYIGFYQKQNQANNPLTPFDRFVLRCALERIPDKKVAGDIESRTGVPLERGTLILYRDTLTYGRIFSGQAVY